MIKCCEDKLLKTIRDVVKHRADHMKKSSETPFVIETTELAAIIDFSLRASEAQMDHVMSVFKPVKKFRVFYQWEKVPSLEECKKRFPQLEAVMDVESEEDVEEEEDEPEEENEPEDSDSEDEHRKWVDCVNIGKCNL